MQSLPIDKERLFDNGGLFLYAGLFLYLVSLLHFGYIFLCDL